MKQRLVVLSVWAFAVGVVSLSVPLAAQSQAVHVGAGSQSCGAWVTLHLKQQPATLDTLKKSMAISWVQGYIVGSARSLTGWLNCQSSQSLPVWVRP